MCQSLDCTCTSGAAVAAYADRSSRIIQECGCSLRLWGSLWYRLDCYCCNLTVLLPLSWLRHIKKLSLALGLLLLWNLPPPMKEHCPFRSAGEALFDGVAAVAVCNLYSHSDIILLVPGVVNIIRNVSSIKHAEYWNKVFLLGWGDKIAIAPWETDIQPNLFRSIIADRWL